jgi:polysaccharide pyruvyl transferase WcaK-like protein
MTALFRRCAAVIAMRLHALILATTLNVPFLAIAYDPKVSALLDSVRYPLPPLEQGQAAQLVSRLWSERDALQAGLAEAAPELRRRAAQSFDWLQALVEGAVS